jgi:hypothetical protein
MLPLLLRAAPCFSNPTQFAKEQRPPRTGARPQHQVSFSVGACDANYPFGRGVPLRTPELSSTALPAPARMRMCARENRNLRNKMCRPVPAVLTDPRVMRSFEMRHGLNTIGLAN